MKRVISLVGTLCGYALIMNQAQGLPQLRIQPTTADQPSGSLIYKDADLGIYHTNPQTDVSFANHYVVSMPSDNVSTKDLSKFGQVVGSAPGKFAVVLVEEQQLEQLSGYLHEKGLPCGSLFQLNGDPVVDHAVINPTPRKPLANTVAHIQQAIATVDASNIKQFVEELSNLHTRHANSATGKTVADFLGDKYRSLAGNRDDVTIGTFEHGNKTSQPSLYVRIEGQTNPDEIVILGSHIDSINWMQGTNARSPGADDNASGTATNLEIFRIIMEQNWTFDRTLEIHGYAAEELGLVGSQDWARKYRADNKNVISMVQHDMNIYRSGPADKIWLISNNTNASLNRNLGQLIDQYVGIPWGQKVLSGGNSDHYSWTRKGYASAFPFEDPSNYNPNIHTSRDTVSNGPAFTQAAAFAKLGLSYLGHFAGSQIANQR